MGVQGSSEELRLGKKLVSRRAVNIGAAWSVPVILTAVAAPTASASPGGEPQPTSGSLVHTTGQGFKLTLVFPAGSTGTVTLVRVYTSQTDFKPVNGQTTVAIVNGQAVFQVQRLDNNSDKTAIVTYKVGDGLPLTLPVAVTM